MALLEGRLRRRRRKRKGSIAAEERKRPEKYKLEREAED